MTTSEANLLSWLQNWYKANCNGDWEHIYGVKIETLDNSGWSVIIDLKDTNLENLEREYRLIENSDEDWYTLSIKDSKFQASGDSFKLETLLYKFKEIIEGYNAK
jgi:hypothetical protein